MADTKPELEARLEQLEQQNNLLMTMLQGFAGQTQAKPRDEEQEIVNNGWRPLYNPKRRNPDNRDWEPGTKKRWDPDRGYKVGYNTFHTGDGMWEWGYEDPDTGKIKWSGKLIGEKPPGPPTDPPVPLEKLREQAQLAVAS